jgi:hypothetical protein
MFLRNPHPQRLSREVCPRDDVCVTAVSDINRLKKRGYCEIPRGDTVGARGWEVAMG